MVVNLTFIDDARERNMLSGVIIIDLIAFISYIIFPAGLIYFGDIQMIIGCIIGTHFAIKNIKPNQNILSLGVLVGLSGCVLTGISYSLFDWVVYSSSLLLNLIIFELYLVEAIIIALVFGGLISGYYFYIKKKIGKNM
ncbi:MAG: hypothetical protein ACFE8N_11425 [Promethearchaeota archaeon]